MNVEHLDPVGRGPTSGYVYRCFDTDGQALYVGITNNPDRRLADHRQKQTWWPDVALVEVVEVRGVPGSSITPRSWPAHRFEAEEIARLRPLHNRHHNPDWRWSFYAKAFVPASLPYRGTAEAVELVRYIGASLEDGAA